MGRNSPSKPPSSRTSGTINSNAEESIPNHHQFSCTGFFSVGISLGRTQGKIDLTGNSGSSVRSSRHHIIRECCLDRVCRQGYFWPGVLPVHPETGLFINRPLTLFHNGGRSSLFYRVQLQRPSSYRRRPIYSYRKIKTVPLF